MVNPTQAGGNGGVDEGQDRQWYANTWRYLRLAMMGIPLALFAAIIEDRFKDAGHCFQSSVSSYYYTPVHGFLIGALVSVGVCLYCLQGRNTIENVLLNLAGMAAPVVAFVPTSPPGTCVSDSITAERFSNAGNNMFALTLLESVALIVIFRLRSSNAKKTHADVAGFSIAAAIVGGEWVLSVLFLTGVKVYLIQIHYTAAIFLFVCLFFAVIIHVAVSAPGKGFWYHFRHPNRDAWIAIAMVTSFVVFLALSLGGWTYAVFQIELCLLVLFMAFWRGETAEEWVPVLEPARLPQLLQPLARRQ